MLCPAAGFFSRRCPQNRTEVRTERPRPKLVWFSHPTSCKPPSNQDWGHPGRAGSVLKHRHSPASIWLREAAVSKVQRHHQAVGARLLTCGSHGGFNRRGIYDRPVSEPLLSVPSTKTSRHRPLPPSSRFVLSSPSTRSPLQPMPKLSIQAVVHLPLPAYPPFQLANKFPLLFVRNHQVTHTPSGPFGILGRCTPHVITRALPYFTELHDRLPSPCHPLTRAQMVDSDRQ